MGLVKSAVVLILFVCIRLAISQAYIIPDLQRDDFTVKKSWWRYQNFGDQIPPDTHNGYLHAALIDPLDGGPGGRIQSSATEGDNVGITTVDQKQIYGKDDIIEATIRIKTLNDLPVGSRGWGFWKSERLPEINQAVWFIQQTAHPDSVWAAEETRWQARVTNGLSEATRKFVDLDGAPYFIDNQQWHVYKTIRHGRSYYEHYVDGQLVLHIEPTDFPGNKILNEDYAFNCWNDNIVYHHITNPDTIEGFTNGWLGKSEFVVDYVEIRSQNYKPGYSLPPAGTILLREVVNEFDDGISDGLWKGPYSFNTNGGACVLLATAKAEQYGTYDDDDDLKMVLDSKDFGYNTARSWDGNSDDSAVKTVVIDTVLPAGQHALEFHSEVTPELYDATVLGSANGGLVLNLTLNESAPAGSNNLEWKTFSFNCGTGQVAIYISGTADEEPGWNYQNSTIDSTDDDELRVVLDNIDYGWGSDSSMVGNTLFGNMKSILITEQVQAGLHTLKLYANQTPTVYSVLVFAENKEGASEISDPPNFVNQFRVLQNYPNPFNPSTRIRFVLDQSRNVRVDVFNSTGQHIRTVWDDYLHAGRNELVWDGTDEAYRPVSSGVYFYEINSGSERQVRKMMLIR